MADYIRDGNYRSKVSEGGVRLIYEPMRRTRFRAFVRLVAIEIF